MVKTLFLIFTFFGIVFAWILAAGQLFSRKRDLSKYIAFALFLSVGVWQVVLAGYHTGILRALHFFIGVHVSFIFLSSPLFYFYYQVMLDPDYLLKTKGVKLFLHFVPALIVTLLILPYYFIDINDKIQYLHFQPNLQVDPGSILINILILAGIFNIILYIFILLKKKLNILLVHWRNLRKKPVIVITFFQIVFLLITALIAFFGKLLYGNVSGICSILVTILLIAIFITGIRYPQYMQRISQEMERTHYERSRLHNLNVGEIISRLHHLMEVDRAFCDEDITISQVADELSITIHQLSEILNNKLRKNFYEFINEYRIEAAKDLIVDEPDRSFTSVAYAVGFNSRSSFYSAFKKFTGLSPGTYRKKYL